MGTKNSTIRIEQGDQFGRWTTIQKDTTTAKYPKWICQCICGKEKSVDIYSLVKGTSTSCGCYAREDIIQRSTIHGQSRRHHHTPEVNAYYAAKGRCNNPNNPRYPRYGGRGIEFRFQSFEEFYAEVGNRPTSRHSVERIEKNGHYEKGNLCWATPKEQACNRVTNVPITLNGITKLAIEWSDEVKIKHLTLCARKRYNWCDFCCLTIPVNQGRCQHKN